MPASNWTLSPSAPSGKFLKAVKADGDLALGACRGLCVGTAGTANLKSADGDDAPNFPLQVGYNPVSVIQVKIGGTADDIWLLY